MAIKHSKENIPEIEFARIREHAEAHESRLPKISKLSLQNLWRGRLSRVGEQSPSMPPPQTEAAQIGKARHHWYDHR